MKRIKLFLAFSFLAVVSLAPRAEVVVNDKSQINFIAFIPCANGGSGELAAGSIRLHTLLHNTFDGAGGGHFSVHYQPMGASLVGLNSGDIYNGTGMTKSSDNFNSAGLPITTTHVNNFRMIGKGNAVNFMIHTTIHVTINELGEVTADVNKSSVTCK